MTEPSPTNPPTPPTQRNGCLQALAIVIGIVLLLPGLCAIMLLGTEPRIAREDMLFLLLLLGIGAGGIALIWWAVRRPRQ